MSMIVSPDNSDVTAESPLDDNGLPSDGDNKALFV